MNLENVKKLVTDKKIERIILFLLEYEQSKLHLDRVAYKDEYNKIIEEFIDENK